MGVRQFLLLLPGLMSPAGALTAQSTESVERVDSVRMVVEWLEEGAIPLRFVQAGNGFADMEPLREIFQGVSVVGLGEATHGTREFFEIKHRFLEFLASEMGFTAFAIEGAYSDAQPLNDYVLNGVGEVSSLLTRFGYMAWDTEEVSAMLRWMREYNQRVPAERKIRFYGVDLFGNSVGRQEILTFLRSHAPERVAEADSVFRILAAEEEKWPFWDAEAASGLFVGLSALSDYLSRNRESLVRRASPSELDRVSEYLRVMLRAVRQIDRYDRGLYMAQNLLAICQRAPTGTRFVLWAHNGHVSKGHAGGMMDDALYYSTGGYLRRELGERYYAVALEFEEGVFQYRRMPPPGPLEVGIAPPAASGSLPWYLASGRFDVALFNLRRPAGNSLIHDWLSRPFTGHGIGWGYAQPPGPDELVWEYTGQGLGELFDGVLFIRRTTAATPTPAALQMAREGVGF